MNDRNARQDFRYEYLDGSPAPWTPGKVVCVGRNYLEHIRELDNPVPDRPVLFMKPATALVPLGDPIVLPAGQGECHHEVELAVLIGKRLRGADPGRVRDAAAGYGIALDLTLRDVQKVLKEQGQPWERAKAFDGSCPLSPLVAPGELDPERAELQLTVNGAVRQHGDTRQMLRGVFDLVSHISHTFTLLPGDLVLTGTPAGVGPLRSGDRLELLLDGRFRFATRVT